MTQHRKAEVPTGTPNFSTTSDLENERAEPCQNTTEDRKDLAAVPPIVDQPTWETALTDLRSRKGGYAGTRRHRRDPAAPADGGLFEYTLEGADGPVRLADVLKGKHQLIVYNHMWFPGETWQCSGCTGLTSQYTRLEFLDPYDARFVIVTQGPIDEALAYKARVGNKMTWHSTANSPFGTDMGAAFTS